MNRIRKGALLVQHMGIGWLCFRLLYAAQRRFGWFVLRCPAKPWSSFAREDPWIDSVCADGRVLLERLRTRRERFIFDRRALFAERDELRRWDACELASVTDEAEAVLRGEFRYFSGERRKRGFPPAWHVEPVGEREFPRREHWSKSGDFAHGDIKVYWELSRFGFTYDLARAYVRTGDDRHAEGFWLLVESWIAENPPNLGVNWKCGQEISLRVMAWCVGLHAFLDSSATTPLRVACLAQAILVSGRRIERNIAYALSQRSNHGHSEAAGLFTIGIVFPDFKESTRWRDRGLELLNRLTVELNYSDGDSCMHSNNYLRMMLDVLLWCGALAARNGIAFDAVVKERVATAAELLFQQQNPESGGVPLYGANDGTNILPLSSRPYADFRPVVQAATWYATGRLRYADGPWNERLWWMHSEAAVNAPLAEGASASFSAMPSGYHILRAPESRVFLRCGPNRHRAGHADMLHLDLEWKGLNLLRDAGSYCYNSAPPFTGAFKDTAVHNTVGVDGLDQMEKITRFLYLPPVEGRLLHSTTLADGRVSALIGEHDGYARLTHPVRHRRYVFLLQTDELFVLDRLESKGFHDYDLHWLLADCPYLPQRGSSEIKLQTLLGPWNLCTGSDKTPGRAVMRAPTESPRGWCSPLYYGLCPAISLSTMVRGTTATFWTYGGHGSVEVTMENNRCVARFGDLCLEVLLEKPVYETGAITCSFRQCSTKS